MKNNKGFTLIELLGIVVVLVAIFLVAFPSLLGTTKQDEEKLYTSMVDDLCLAGETYIYSHIDDYPELSTPNSVIKINISTLIKDGSVSKDRENPKTGELIKNNLLKFTVLEDKSLKCEYHDEVTIAHYITELYNNSIKTNSLEVDGIIYQLDTTNNLMDDRLGGIVESGGNIRYYGTNPNNYIDIGDKDSSGNIILWRIIGVFETKYATESQPCNIDSDSDGHFDNCASDKLVKVIRNDSIGNIGWDANNVNDWSTATLNTYLNTSTYYSSLNTDVTSKTENVLWNLGGYSAFSGVYANDWYGYERGTLRYTGRPTECVGKIGLMYLSDYGYATDLTKCSKDLYNYNSSTDSYACRTNDWLYNSDHQWTLSPVFGLSSDVFMVYSPGFAYRDGANYAYGVRPVLYLKSDTVLTGTATTEDGITYYVVE